VQFILGLSLVIVTALFGVFLFFHLK